MNGPCWRYLTCPPSFARGFCYAEHCQGSWWSVCLFCPTFRGDLVSSQLSAKTKKVIHKLRWQARKRLMGEGEALKGFCLPNLSVHLCMYVQRKINTTKCVLFLKFGRLLTLKWGSKFHHRRLWMPPNTKEEKSLFCSFPFGCVRIINFVKLSLRAQ